MPGGAGVLAAIGALAYGARIPADHAAALVITVLAGAASFAAIGFALATLIRGADSAQPAIAAITLPLYFISGVFLASTLLPHWLLNVAGVFPVRPFQQALLAVYNPYSSGTGFSGHDLLIVAAWGNHRAARRHPRIPLDTPVQVTQPIPPRQGARHDRQHQEPRTDGPSR